MKKLCSHIIEGTNGRPIGLDPQEPYCSGNWSVNSVAHYEDLVMYPNNELKYLNLTRQVPDANRTLLSKTKVMHTKENPDDQSYNHITDPTLPKEVKKLMGRLIRIFRYL